MTLATYITANFLSLKTQLAWSDSLEITAITEKALEFYGVDLESEATDLTKLHALADVAVWRQALNEVSLDYNFSADNASYSRSQQADMIRKNLESAVTDAIVYNANYAIGINWVDNNEDWNSA